MHPTTLPQRLLVTDVDDVDGELLVDEAVEVVDGETRTGGTCRSRLGRRGACNARHTFVSLQCRADSLLLDRYSLLRYPCRSAHGPTHPTNARSASNTLTRRSHWRSPTTTSLATPPSTQCSPINPTNAQARLVSPQIVHLLHFPSFVRSFVRSCVLCSGAESDLTRCRCWLVRHNGPRQSPRVASANTPTELLCTQQHFHNAYL
jgi:hypothetical protein